MRISRLLLSGAAIGTIVGTARADLNRTHVFNSNWPPHARFHGAAGWGTITGSQLLALWLVWRTGQAPTERDLAIKTAALLPAIAWTPFFPALATPGNGRGRRTRPPASRRRHSREPRARDTCTRPRRARLPTAPARTVSPHRRLQEPERDADRRPPLPIQR